MRKHALARWLLSISMLLIFSATRAQMSGTYTINPAQPAGPTNFQTFNQAITKLKLGITGSVTINVAPGSGPYNERIHLNHTIKSSASRTVTFNCNGVTLSFLSKDGDQKSGILIDSADYITIDSLVIVPQGVNEDEFGWGVHLVHDADHNTITRCRILNQHNLGIEPQRNDNIIINGNMRWGTDDGNSSCDSNTISNNYITGGYCGITLSSNGEGANMISGNKITGNVITDFENAGVLLNGNASETLVDGNDITQPNAIYARGIILFLKNESSMISNNRIHNINNIYGLPVSGIFVCSEAFPGKETVIANNLIYDLVTNDEQNGIEIRYGSPASYVKIIHNTIVLDNDNPTNEFASFGINIGYNSNNIQIFNNIIQVTRTTTTENYGVFVESFTPGLESENNNWHIASPSAMINAIANLEGLQCITLADWQGATGFDLSSSEADPLFTDRPSGNLKPTQGSIDNKGKVTEITKDITGLTRDNSTPDVGAYEFDGPACTVPVAGFAKGSPTNTTCEGQPLILTLTGNSTGKGQTYQWQSDASETGSFSNNLNAPQGAPAYEIRPSATLYYRAAVTCGATTVYSDVIPIYVNPSLAAGTYTVDPAQPASATNYQSLLEAVNAMQCGIRGPVVFEMAPGTYNEQLTITPVPGASATKTVTFNGRGATLNVTPFFSEERSVIKLDGAKYITIDSMNIEIPSTDNDGFGFGVLLTNNADHNTVKNSTITFSNAVNSFNYAGIVMSATNENAANVIDGSYCDSNTIHNNTVTGGFYGITCTSSEIEGLSIGNSITNNTLKDNYAYGIYVANANNLTIDGNEVSRPTRTDSYAEFSAILLSSRNVDLRVRNNRIHDLSAGDLSSTAQIVGLNFLYSYSTPDAPQLITNNLVYRLNGRGLQQGLLYNTSPYAQFYHNTISLEDPLGNSAEPTRGMSVFGSPTTGLIFKNNLIAINRAGSGIKHCMFVGPAGATYESDNNNFYMSAGAGNFVGQVGGTNYAQLSDWKTGTSKDAKSVSVNPAFIDEPLANFEPTASAMENRGTFVGVTTDITGKTRSITTPDIGAIEYSVCTDFPAVAASRDSLSVCKDESATFNVRNPQANNTYNWYSASTGGAVVFTGTSYTVNQVSAATDLWIEATSPEGCNSLARAHVQAVPLKAFDHIDVTADSIGITAVVFKWDAVPGAIGYQISRDGVKFEEPSSGLNGFTHLLKDLKPNDTVGLVVRALGRSACQQITSDRLVVKTRISPFYIPNTFTPNGNGQNDDFRVYTNLPLKSMHLMVFNQWGEKVFETTNPGAGWDGTYKGKPQPVGVYVYAAKLLFIDDTSANQKGTLNLVR